MLYVKTTLEQWFSQSMDILVYTKLLSFKKIAFSVVQQLYTGVKIGYCGNATGLQLYDGCLVKTEHL